MHAEQLHPGNRRALVQGAVAAAAAAQHGAAGALEQTRAAHTETAVAPPSLGAVADATCCRPGHGFDVGGRSSSGSHHL